MNSSSKKETSMIGITITARAILPIINIFFSKMLSLKPLHNKYDVTGIFNMIPEITPGIYFFISTEATMCGINTLKSIMKRVPHIKYFDNFFLYFTKYQIIHKISRVTNRVANLNSKALINEYKTFID